MNCLNACTALPIHKGTLCRIEFDYTDEALTQLNTQNLRALVRFKEMCQPIKENN